MKTSAIHDPFKAAEDPAMPFLAEALDPYVMEAKLDAALRAAGSREPETASLRSLRESGRAPEESLADGTPSSGSGKSWEAEFSGGASETPPRIKPTGRGDGGIEEGRAENTPGSPLPNPGSRNLRLAEIRVVRHKPGKRCLVEYDIEADGGLFTVIGKVRARGMDAKSLAVQKGLWEEGFGDGGRFAVARPLGAIPGLHMWFQKKESGVVATEMLSGPDGERIARGVAELSHELHARGVSPKRPPHTMGDELRILHERLPLVSGERVEWRVRIERVLAACRRLGRSLPDAAPVPSHRDFYADQILVDGERLRLLDFDLYCEGDPGLDAGNFVAHVTEYSMRTLGSPDALKNVEDAMVERFVELSGEGVREAALVYAALTLARHIHISRRMPERRGFTEGLLELCEERLLVGGGRRVRGI